MKKFKTTTLALLVALGAFAQNKTWTTDHSHSSVNFSVDHMVISQVPGQFKDFTGTVTTTGTDFNNAQVEFTIQAASIFTDDDKRDEHLKSADFFDAAKFPQITFKSTSFKKVDDKNYTLTGNLTMHGVTKTVTFKVKYNGTVKDPWGKTRAGFKLSSQLNRKDFGLTWNKALETGGLVVGEEVELTGNIEVVQQ